MLTDKFVRCEASECLESLGEVINHEKRLEMLFELLGSLVIVRFDRSFFECPIHAYDLSIGP